jgi:hypothetical protein
MSDYSYYPFVRTGLSTGVTGQDATPPVAPPFVALSVSGVVAGSSSTPVQLRLAGPGEVRGLDRRTVIRTDPADGSLGVPPNLFAAVELQPPDLPWMFTPLAPNGQRLRPWLCLVVTDLEETGEPVVDTSKPLPVLHVPDPASMLPNPDEAWAWAHVAAAGTPTSLESTIDSNPEQVVARLLCPRKLSPERRYVAAVVPVFAGGAAAGLGEDPGVASDVIADPAKIQNAWSVAAGAKSVDLPVYFSWEFQTGVGGDFHSLALRLQGRPLDPGAGTRPMDITSPGGGLPDLPANAATKNLGLEGALAPDQFQPTPWDSGESATFASGISGLVAAANTAPASLGPPLWGRWPAAQLLVPATTPAWLRSLNIDPRSRAAAGLGALVVQQQREQLLAQAWEQVGDVERANQRLRQAQLARAHGRSLYLGGLPALGDGSFLQLTRPLQDRVLVGAKTTAYAEIADGAVPERLFDGAFRRLARARGPLGRRMGLHPGSTIEKAAAGAATAAPPSAPPKGSGVIVAQVEHLPATALKQRAGTAGFTPLTNWWKPFSTGTRETADDTPLMAAFRAEVAAYETWKDGTRRAPQTRPALDPGSLRARITAAVDPDDTVHARTSAVVTAPNWDGAGDPLEPIMAAPVFRQPMVDPLAALSQALVLPGLEGIPADTVTAAVPNAAFIAAYMVGLSHEMANELLFAEYPTDQRGTYFPQFWDTRGRVPAAAPGTTDDITPIDGWLPAHALGDDVSGGGSGLLVVIIRGELLRRYPNATLYVQAAKWTAPVAPATEVTRRELDPSGTTLYPVLRGRLEPDLVYFGVQLSADDARGTEPPSDPSKPAGYFVVFEQHPTAPHYGLDDGAAAAGGGPAAWNQVTWGDVTPPGADPTKPVFVPATKPSWWTKQLGGPAWGASSAALAAITLQRPTRLALHASDLLPTPPSS